MILQVPSDSQDSTWSLILLFSSKSSSFLKCSPRSLQKWSNLTNYYFSTQLGWNHQVVPCWLVVSFRWGDGGASHLWDPTAEWAHQHGVPFSAWRGFADRKGDHLEHASCPLCLSRWWQLKHFLCSPLFGGMIQFDYSNIFSLGWNHHL